MCPRRRSLGQRKRRAARPPQRAAPLSPASVSYVLLDRGAPYRRLWSTAGSRASLSPGRKIVLGGSPCVIDNRTRALLGCDLQPQRGQEEEHRASSAIP